MSLYLSSGNRRSARNGRINTTAVVPFGRYGAGLITEHPVGLVVAVGVILIGLEAIPPARWFFVGSVAAGAVIGFLMWLHHRSKNFG